MPTYILKRPVINGKSGVWYVTWTDGRRSRRVSTKTDDKRRAEQFLAQFQAIQAAPPEKVTCADLSQAYLEERIESGRVKYPNALKNCIKHTDAYFGDLPPSMVERITVRMYTKSRQAQGVMDSTIDKELRIFRQTLKFGVKEKWIEREPHVATPGGSAGRQRFLTRSEFAAIYYHSSPLHLKMFLGLAIDTLARGKAILGLLWDRVDFDAGVIWYAQHDPRSKKHSVQVPMTERLRSLLLIAQEAAQTPFVIEWQGEPVKSVRKAYERAVRLAGVSDAHRHDLRRTGASWAVQDGIGFDRVAALLGDSEEITRKHYAMFDPIYLKGVVDAIATGGR